jgi:purine-binding chemotaxis protein CheW
LERQMKKHLQIVVFRIGKEFYGVSIDAVQEIVRVPAITAIPDAPSYFEGVINLRGRIVPVVDLRGRLRLPREEPTKSSRMLITENGGRVIGLLVDAVSEVRKLAHDSVESPPEMISAVGIEYITGVAKIADRLIIFLDIKKVLNPEDMKQVSAAAGNEGVNVAA